LKRARYAIARKNVLRVDLQLQIAICQLNE